MSAAIVSYRPEFLSEITEIFFESSLKKDFKDQQDKEDFFFKYLGFYLKQYPELALVAVDNRLLGYVVASPESLSPELQRIQPHLKVFSASFAKFPAHLHINCHHEARGKGIGKRLMQQIELLLKERGLAGLHIMTGNDSENQNFYKKLGFHHEVKEDFQGSSILLMGKSLSEN